MSRPILSDFSFSAFSAGFVAVLIGFSSSVAIVFQAAQAAGATQSMTVSWIIALGIGMGVTCLGYSWYYKQPVITAWSTPGAALLAVSLTGVPIEQAIGAFLFAGLLTTLLGLSGMFDRIMARLPLPIASAMLAGILFKFGLDVFLSVKTNPWLVGIMLISYLLGKRWLPRYSVLLVLATGILVAFVIQHQPLESVELQFSMPVWVTPAFDWQVLLGIGLPLFIVTMTSQNVPGVATLRASGYRHLPISPVITGTGLATLLLAPFGGFAFNLAAITAAICTNPESHPDPDKRYIAGLSAGLFYILAGVGGATVVAIFTAFPVELVAALAGIALFGTIAASLASATAQPEYREAAVITLLVTASGIELFGIASPFWGLIAGVIAHLFICQKH
ncbi:benzoate/H(+) symporter BenE family transporter [Neptunicella sp. SCSIO 80796]|uniref:benzoate/H(+) symporter BenE family transporter n=1 Tax=Neptunicella plasticusilytica TaxID=3117012 RepID=UPI003A4D699B